MPTKATILLLPFLFVTFALAAQAPADTTGIIPAPRQVSPGKGHCVIDRNRPPRVIYLDPAARKAAGLLNDYLARNYGIPPGGNAAGTIITFRTATVHNNAEGYTLNIKQDSISITGSEAGQFYALQSLLQLVRPAANGGLRIPCLAIADWPRYAYRGIMQDVGYHVYPVSFIKSQLDMLAAYKMNTYHWHLTEDHGWRIEIKKYPRLTTVGARRAQTQVSNYDDAYTGLDGAPYGGYYTREEIRDVVAYAAARHITVIPEIELPGHSVAALAAYPELACGDNPGPFKVAETWGIFDDVYCAGKENTFTFLENVLTEVMELFPSKYIHIGGDECPKDRWKQCRYCQQRIRDQGLKDEFELQSYFVKRIEKFVNSKGRRIIGWDEILEGGLAPGVTVMNWRGQTGVQAAREGHDVIMAPHQYVYFDFIQGKRALEPLAIDMGYNPIESVYSFDPTPAELAPEHQKHIIGVEAPLWTEHMDTYRKVEYMLYPRLMALAEIAWTPPARKNARDFFERRLPRHLAALDTTGRLYRVPAPIGISDSTYRGGEFTIALQPPVDGASIYYNFEGQDARETDYLYEKPFRLHVPENQRRIMKLVVITPTGKRSAQTTAIFDNTAPAAEPAALQNQIHSSKK